MPFDDYRDIAEAEEARTKKTIRDDYGKEGTGWPTGKLPRFFASAAQLSAKAEKEREKTADFLREFWLTQDYLEQYAAFGKTLRDAETRIQTVLAELRDALAKFDTAIQEAQANGTRLPDGRVVFRFDDGSVIDQDGEPVDPADVESVVFNPNAMRGEDYIGLLVGHGAVAQQIKKDEKFEVDVLGRARDRYADQENRITPEEMEKFQTQIDDYVDALEPTAVPTPDMAAPDADLGILPPTTLPTIKG
ncbi:MAG: hypothetical protein ACFB03_03190 [Paracoccaceae bacterium]